MLVFDADKIYIFHILEIINNDIFHIFPYIPCIPYISIIYVLIKVTSFSWSLHHSLC